jgi:hypothetical protein
MAHLVAQEPPQSTSVSVPFLTPSVQENPHVPLARQIGPPGGQVAALQQSWLVQHC